MTPLSPSLSAVQRKDEPFNYASAAESAARAERIVIAATRRTTRLSQIITARRTLRECEILTPWELLAALNNLDAQLARHVGPSDMNRYKEMVNAVTCEIESELLGGDSEDDLSRAVDQRRGSL